MTNKKIKNWLNSLDETTEQITLYMICRQYRGFVTHMSILSDIISNVTFRKATGVRRKIECFLSKESAEKHYYPEHDGASTIYKLDIDNHGCIFCEGSNLQARLFWDTGDFKKLLDWFDIVE